MECFHSDSVRWRGRLSVGIIMLLSVVVTCPQGGGTEGWLMGVHVNTSVCASLPGYKYSQQPPWTSLWPRGGPSDDAGSPQDRPTCGELAWPVCIKHFGILVPAVQFERNLRSLGASWPCSICKANIREGHFYPPKHCHAGVSLVQSEGWS